MKYLLLIFVALFITAGFSSEYEEELDNLIIVGKDYGIIIPVTDYKHVETLFSSEGSKFEIYRNINQPSKEFYFSRTNRDNEEDLNNSSLCELWDQGKDRCFQSGKSGNISIFTHSSDDSLSMNIWNGTKHYFFSVKVDEYDHKAIRYWNQFFDEVAEGIEFCDPLERVEGYFYDHNTEMFHHPESTLNLKVPKDFEVELDSSQSGKCSSKFSTLNGDLEVYITWFSEPVSFEQSYREQSALLKKTEIQGDYRYTNSMEKITVGNGIPAYRIRYIAENRLTGKLELIVNEYHFFNDHFSFELNGSSKPAHEKELLKAIEQTLESISFIED